MARGWENEILSRASGLIRRSNGELGAKCCLQQDRVISAIRRPAVLPQTRQPSSLPFANSGQAHAFPAKDRKTRKKPSATRPRAMGRHYTRCVSHPLPRHGATQEPAGNRAAGRHYEMEPQCIRPWLSDRRWGVATFPTRQIKRGVHKFGIHVILAHLGTPALAERMLVVRGRNHNFGIVEPKR